MEEGCVNRGVVTRWWVGEVMRMRMDKGGRQRSGKRGKKGCVITCHGCVCWCEKTTY